VRLSHAFRVAAVVLAAGLSAAACSSPSYNYISDSADHLYFKVPPTWSTLSQNTLRAAQAQALGASPAGPEGGPIIWSTAIDASPRPSVAHVFSIASQPVVYASVQELNSTARAGMSFDAMRNLLLPVTSVARQAVEKSGGSLSGFHSIADAVLTPPGGLRGINEVFQYNLGATPEVFDQTVLTNSETTKLYLLLVQCDESCFASHARQIATVVRSFTVQGS
jgi:hypothetical protein